MQKDRIYSIIVFSRFFKIPKRRVNFILKRKLKFYTKESFKYFNMAIIAFGFIAAIVCIKYKPMYEVRISGVEVGYIEDKENFIETVQGSIEHYTAKNVDTVSLDTKPEYELKLVNKLQQTNESDVLIAIQKEMKITYKYYEIACNGEVIDAVDTKEQADNLVSELKEKDTKISVEVVEKKTENVEEVKTNELEMAKQNVIAKMIPLKKDSTIASVKGLQIATLPVKGTITSRYGVQSRIRVSTHTGLDISAPTGTPIKVVIDGTVTCAAYSGSYGNLIKVKHENGVETWYGHTDKMYVSVGQKVAAGDVIAAVGSTGNSTGPHLHLEIRINGQHVNPQKYLYQ